MIAATGLRTHIWNNNTYNRYLEPIPCAETWGPYLEQIPWAETWNKYIEPIP